MIDPGALTGWDWFVLAALLISTALGLLSGLVKTVFALAGWVAGLVGAPLLTPAVMDASGWTVHPLFVMALLFFVLLVAVRLFGVLLSRILSRVGLGGVDRTLGAVLGVARALLIVTVVAVAGRALGAHQEAAWQKAVSRPLLEQMLALVDPLLPEGGERSGKVRRT
ncbi:CvpA family protein [Burkholderiaceae bacterium FT117]|uniref:CvpA family protein n=1 Tax=Zeimonas sediminis TaxID=2944268 RepID=UPI0023432367|nr:CvpA family protein [Zeimonas sediminis]MCM5569540.1 CvpA family protein [Zeimonas sediminis]